MGRPGGSQTLAWLRLSWGLIEVEMVGPKPCVSDSVGSGRAWEYASNELPCDARLWRALVLSWGWGLESNGGGQSRHCGNDGCWEETLRFRCLMCPLSLVVCALWQLGLAYGFLGRPQDCSTCIVEWAKTYKQTHQTGMDAHAGP